MVRGVLNLQAYKLTTITTLIDLIGVMGIMILSTIRITTEVVGVGVLVSAGAGVVITDLGITTTMVATRIMVEVITIHITLVHVMRIIPTDRDLLIMEVTPDLPTIRLAQEIRTTIRDRMEQIPTHIPIVTIRDQIVKELDQHQATAIILVAIQAVATTEVPTTVVDQVLRTIPIVDRIRQVTTTEETHLVTTAVRTHLVTTVDLIHRVITAAQVHREVIVAQARLEVLEAAIAVEAEAAEAAAVLVVDNFYNFFENT